MATVQALEAPAGDARAALRVQTRADHERLHRLPAFASLAAGTLDRHGYRHLLVRLHAFHHAADAALRAACLRYASERLGYHWFGRAEHLAADLAALADQTAGVMPVFAASVPPAESFAEFAGIAYVVEGSLLGAISLGRSARVLLAQDPRATHNYWSWCQAVAGDRVAAMHRLVEAADSEPTGRHSMIATARCTFDAFGQCFTAPLTTADVAPARSASGDTGHRCR